MVVMKSFYTDGITRSADIVSISNIPIYLT